MHRVELRHCAPQAWRNGGGLTHELLAWPRADANANANANDWALRVSVARIDADGPFSAFAGMRRCFAVLRGAGVRLDLPGGPVTLTPADEAIGFDGAAAPGCQLIDGATDDLNLMARANAGQPRLQRARAGSRWPPARWRGFYACSDVQLQCGDQWHTATADTLLWDDRPAPAWQLQQGSGWWLSLEADTL